MPQRFLTSLHYIQKKLRNKYILWSIITVLAISITILVIVFYDTGTRAKIHGTANETLYKVPESVTLNGMLIQFEEAATTDTVVHYEVSGGSAVQGEDYELFGNSISVPPGKTETTIPLRVVNDQLREPNETITFNIFTESGGTLESSITVTYTILDDDDTNGSYVQGTAVLPAAVPDLQLWLDSRDESTLNLTTNNLTEWKDKSKQNNHFTQPNATYQPAYDAEEKAIVFDGSDDFLSNSDILTTTDFTNQEVTMIAVYKPDNDTQYSVTDTGSSTSGYWRYSSNNHGYFDEFRSKRLEQTPPDMPSSGKHIVTMQSAPGTGTYKIWLDNELKTQKDPEWGVQNDFLIGKGAHGGPLRGNVYALVVYNRALTE
ncbi:MAG: Calx-beta domain-containing protein, partial [Candidatus Dojkabacteria bacterium]